MSILKARFDEHGAEPLLRNLYPDVDGLAALNRWGIVAGVPFHGWH